MHEINFADLPETMTLRPSPLKWVSVSLGGLLFTAGGILMIVTGEGAMAWFCTIFFGIVAATGLYMLLGGSYLKLTGEGFEQKMMGRTMVCRWQDVSPFGVWVVSGNRFVSFDRVQDQGKTIARVNQALAGRSASLGDSFGMKAEKLAELMNAFRDRALADFGPDYDVRL